MLVPLLTLLTLTAQTPAAPAEPPAAAPPSDPPTLLSQRIAAVRQETTIAPTLVLVPDEASYFAAIAKWHDGKGRTLFPILIDDGTLAAREDIARFSRAFKPTSTLRFSAKGDAPTAASLTATLATSWGAPDEATYYATLAKRTTAPGPLGAVVTDPTDPARTAAVALASAYGQALIFTPSPAPANGTITIPATDKLSNAIFARLNELKISFNILGDQIDTVALCFNTPCNVTAGASDAPPNAIPQLVAQPGEALSLTDLVGRSLTGFRAERWAYATQIPGTAARAAYNAMSAIFLHQSSAVAFNGYDRTGEFGNYAPTEALKALKQAGLETGFLDRPAQSSEDWRSWASGSFSPEVRWSKSAGAYPKGGTLTNDLFLVNTMGNSDFFQLQPGLCFAGDAPFLQFPAAVNFTHSWSLQHSADPTTVGGRWLDRGAFCYVGSVHEPYLSAFVTQNQFGQRIAKGWPIAIAARVQATDKPANPFSAPWRIAVIGDSLWTLGPALKRSEAPLALAGATDLSTEFPDHVKAQRFAQALDTAAMLGRDDVAARLARAALSENPQKIDNQTAMRAVLIAYRAGDLETVMAAAQKLDPAAEGGPNPTVTDAIWHAVWPQLGTIKADQAQLLAKNVRAYSYTWDTTIAATALKRAVGVEAARAFFDQQLSKAPNDFVKKRLEESRSGIFR